MDKNCKFLPLKYTELIITDRRNFRESGNFEQFCSSCGSNLQWWRHFGRIYNGGDTSLVNGVIQFLVKGETTREWRPYCDTRLINMDEQR